MVRGVSEPAAQRGEFARIRRIISRYTRDRGALGGAASNAVRVDIGDDAVVLAPLAAPTVSVDVAVEGVHFRRAFASLDRLASRAFRAAASDLAAMGATPVGALSALVLPPETTDADLDLLVEGIAQASTALGIPIVGGNVSQGAQLSMTTTVVGNAEAGALTRAGARPGETLYVTGTLGGAAWALEHLLAARGVPDDIRSRWVERPCRLQEGSSLIGHASAAIDVSDGLVQDAQHLAEASGVALHIHAKQLPLAGEAGLDHALFGGEDYELLFCAPAGASLPSGCTPIGTVDVAGGDAAVKVWQGEQLLCLDRSGYQHG